MKVPPFLATVLAAGLCGVLAFVVFRDDPRVGSLPESKASKTGVRVNSSSIADARQWLETSRGSNRAALKQWASGLGEEDLRHQALSFLSLLTASTAPEEWQDRVRMREILAALFMEWGRRDIDGAEAALKDVDGLMADLAFPTALAGYSESKPEDALDRLAAWEDHVDRLMVRPVAMIATFHFAKLDPDKAFERVKHGGGEMEGLAAAFTDPQQRAAVLEWLEAQKSSETREVEFWRDAYYGSWQVEFARGWAQHDLAAAWSHLSQIKEFTDGDLIMLPEWEFWESLGLARPEAAMDFVMEHLAGRRSESEQYVNSVDAAFHGALKSNPDAALARMLRESPAMDKGGASFILSESAAGTRENESATWPIDPISLIPLPLSVRNERILSRIHGFGLGEEEEEKVKERIESKLKDLEE